MYQRRQFKFLQGPENYRGQDRRKLVAEEGHRVDVGDVTDILAVTPEVLIVGTGYAGFMEISQVPSFYAQ